MPGFIETMSSSANVMIGGDRVASQVKGLTSRDRQAQINMLRKERDYSVTGWMWAGGVGLVLVAIIAYAVYALSGSVVVAAISVGIGLLILGVVVRTLLVKCNWSLACFLVGGDYGTQYQPVTEVRKMLNGSAQVSEGQVDDTQ